MSDRNGVEVFKKDFWRREHAKFARPHYRLEKSARLINRMAGGSTCSLLDVGCGPGTLGSLLRPNIDYYGVDISVADPAPNLLEADILRKPIGFLDKRFDMVVALGVFEYLEDVQDQKFFEIAQILEAGGTFLVSYTNFGHRKQDIYRAYSNVQPIARFRRSLEQEFTVRRCFPTSHNWQHGQPTRSLIKAANMHVNLNVPLVGPKLAVEYFFICAPRQSRVSTAAVTAGPAAGT